MKKLQNNFTTPEQSKRLLELGLPADSADCYLQNESQDPLAYVNYTTHIIQPFHDKRIMFSQMEDFIPCWSVGRLIEICKICEPKKDYEQLYEELKYCKDYCVLIISHIIANLPIMDFSKLEEHND